MYHQWGLGWTVYRQYIECVPSMGAGIDCVPSIDRLCTVNGGCICGDHRVIKVVQPNIVAYAVTL